MFNEQRALLVELKRALTFFAGVWYGSHIAFYEIEVDAMFDEAGLPASRDGDRPACDCGL